jgi:heme/copper-type cytochrome/quinol oxidase subunit 2
MDAIVSPASGLRSVSDRAVVVAMLIAATVVLLVLTAFFSILRRFTRQEGREVRASMATSMQWPDSMSGGSS